MASVTAQAAWTQARASVREKPANAEGRAGFPPPWDLQEGEGIIRNLFNQKQQNLHPEAYRMLLKEVKGLNK